MSTAHASLETGSRLDNWWARILSTPGRLKAWYWGGPLAVLLLAAVLRLIDLGHPHSLVFDETFYVKDGWSLWNNGYETNWPSDADAQWAKGITNNWESGGSYVVHPPLGKWLIGLGIWMFGPANSFGWRFAVAVAGIVIVWLVMMMARLLTKSTLLAVIAGGLIAIDGMAIVMSRVSVLDNLVAVLTLTGVYLVLLDRLRARERIGTWAAHLRSQGATDRQLAAQLGPALWWRPFLLLAGLAFGLSCGVKWSGLYFLAGYIIYIVVMDALDRRRAGIGLWFSAAVLKTAPITAFLMVPIAFVSYLATWTGWLLTDNGYYRHWIAEHPDAQLKGFFSWVPMWLQELWHYHSEAYNFHVGMSTPHPYQANPFTWLFMVRPTSMYYVGDGAGVNGCLDNCSSAINPIANPLIWWAATAALFYLVYRLIRYREWTVGFVLMGMIAGYLPWLMYPNRTVFQFYGVIYEPYMILALTLVIGIILGTRNSERSMRVTGIRVVAVFGILSILLSIFFWPVWTGEQIPYWYWQAHMWLPSWI